MKTLMQKFRKPDWAVLIIGTALLQTLALEMLSRHSVLDGLAFVFMHPGVFMINALIVMCSLFLALIFKRRTFVFCLMHILWLTCGIVNCVTTLCRTLPFTFIDITLFKEGIALFDVYFNLFERILIIGASAFGVGLIVFLFFKMPKSDRMPVSRFLGGLVIMLSLTVGSINLGLNMGALSSDFGELNKAYFAYGFPYCFTSTFYDVGVDRPENYSKEAIEEVQEKISPEEPDHSTYTIRPNIVFVQLESFFDPNYIKDLEVTGDPVPTFTRLKKDYPSGLLTVPSIGGGTANSEFEILTGMTLSHFGPGEYPYNTMLTETSVESMAYNLEKLNYTAHAIHNHTGSFYNRHEVYPNLGFDTFTSLEYMADYETNPLGWATDEILTDEIMKAIRSTDGYDFVFCVSVQAHGQYPDEQMFEESMIGESAPETASYWGLDYYLQQLSEVDAFIADLTDTLSDYDEPTMVVFYGDHLPSMGLTAEDLTTGSLYQTEYVIWNNYSGMMQHVGDRDLYAYQLNAYALGLIKIHEGDVLRLHQNYLSESLPEGTDYMNALQLLEYDMLYGDNQLHNGESPYTPKHMRMGISPIGVTKLTVSDEALIVHGTGFTDASEVFFDDEQMTTIYVSPTLLVVPELPDDGAAITVGQMTNDKKLASDRVTLSATKAVYYSAPEEK